MRYKPTELSDGKWAVGAGGSKYFSASVVDTEEEAKQEAYLYSYRWLLFKMDDLADEYAEVYGENLKEDAL